MDLQEFVAQALAGEPGREIRFIGPPGTGKSTMLAGVCEQTAKKYGSDKIMICSLTHSSANSIASKEVTNADGSRHRIPVPRQNIATIHAHAYRGLDRPKLLDVKKNLPTWNDWVLERGYPLYRITLEGGDLDDAPLDAMNCTTAGDSIYSQYSIARARCQEIEAQPEAVRHFAQLWEECKSDLGWMDFAELLDVAYHDLETAPGDPDVILLDEGQDTPLAGMRLVRRWGRKAQVFFTVGDPQQNLYQWSGADTEAFVFPALPLDQMHVLEQSYRVPAAPHAFACRWIAEHQKRVEAQLGIPINYYPRRDADGAVVKGSVRALRGATWMFPEPAIRDALQQIEQGRTCMFIASCGFMLTRLIAKLRAWGIPYWNEYRPTRGDWNPIRFTKRMDGTVAPAPTGNANRLACFLRLDDRLWGDDVGLWTAAELWKWVEHLATEGLLNRGAKEAIKAAAGESGEEGRTTGSHTVTLENLGEWFADLDGLMDIMQQIAEHDPAALDWLRQRVLASKRKGFEYPVTVTKMRGPKALRERPMLTVGSVHSVKGGESQVVYLFPDLSTQGMENYQSPGPGRDSITRQFYVAATRCSEELVLCERATTSAIQYPSLAGLN